MVFFVVVVSLLASNKVLFIFIESSFVEQVEEPMMSALGSSLLLFVL